MHRAPTPTLRTRPSKVTKTSTLASHHLLRPLPGKQPPRHPFARASRQGAYLLASWLCRTCPRAFAERRDYEAHAREHTGAKGKGRKADCDVCDYANKSPDVIRRHHEFDHAADGSHLSQCDYCEYKNESCCGVSFHMLHSHPDRQVRQPKPNGLATPPPTPPKREPPTQAEAARKFLDDQMAELAAMSPVERETRDRPSRERQRRLKRAGLAAP
jgi:hypothetical protein